MAGLILFNRKNNSLARTNTGFEDFYNMLDDFFNDSWLPGRSLARDTFKIDIEETDSEYRIDAELPGVKKEELELGIEGESGRRRVRTTIVDKGATAAEDHVGLLGGSPHADRTGRGVDG